MCPAGCLRACDFFFGALEAMSSSVEMMDSGESGGIGRYGGREGVAYRGVGCSRPTVVGSEKERGARVAEGEVERDSEGDEEAGDGASFVGQGNMYWGEGAAVPVGSSP